MIKKYSLFIIIPFIVFGCVPKSKYLELKETVQILEQKNADATEAKNIAEEQLKLVQNANNVSSNASQEAIKSKKAAEAKLEAYEIQMEKLIQAASEKTIRAEQEATELRTEVKNLKEQLKNCE